MSQPEPPTSLLERLDDTGLDLADESQDIRDCSVIDRDDQHIGHVSSLFIDTTERKVRMMEVRAGGFLGLGERHFLLPIDAITKVTADAVYVNPTGAHIAGSPVYDPEVVQPAPLAFEPFYGYYGYSPFWGEGYLYPGFIRQVDEPQERGGEPPTRT